MGLNLMVFSFAGTKPGDTAASDGASLFNALRFHRSQSPRWLAQRGHESEAWDGRAVKYWRAVKFHTDKDAA